MRLVLALDDHAILSRRGVVFAWARTTVELLAFVDQLAAVHLGFGLDDVSGGDQQLTYPLTDTSPPFAKLCVLFRVGGKGVDFGEDEVIEGLVPGKPFREYAQVRERAVDFGGVLKLISAGVEMLPGNRLAMTKVLLDEIEQPL